MLTIRHLLLAAILACSPAGVSAQGTIDPTISANNKINVAGRQRMLSQRIAKSLCFARMGVETSKHLYEAWTAINLFERSARALRGGSTEMGMLPEQNPRILAALDAVDQEWNTYGAPLRSIITSGDVNNPAKDLLFQNSLTLLSVTHEAVGVIEAEIGGNNDNNLFATGINIAGRQRMLTQRAAKEFCYVLSGIKPEESGAGLQSTMNLFEDSIFGLTFGSDSLNLLEPEVTLEWQFVDILSAWLYLRARIEDGLTHRSEIEEGEILEVARIANILLVESNRAVGMYVAWANEANAASAGGM